MQFSLGLIKEKLGKTVYKAVVVQLVGEFAVVVKTGKLVKKRRKDEVVEEIVEKTIKMPRYRVVGVKYVNPSKGYFKHKVKKIKKELACDFAYESYSHNEKHVMFVDFDTGYALKMGGGAVDYAHSPLSEATKRGLVKFVEPLLVGATDNQKLILGIGLGLFLGIFIANTILPLIEGAV